MLYQDNNNEEVTLSLRDAIKNIIKEIHSIASTPKIPEIKTNPDPWFILDENSILRKVVKLKYSVELTIVAPRKLTNITIIEFHDVKGL